MKGGDKDALARVYKRHYAGLFAFAMSLWEHAQDAEDSIHETFVRAFTKISTFDGNSTFKTWLFAILRYYFLNERSKKYRATESLEASVERSGQEPVSPTASPGPFENTPLEGISKSLLDTALATLKEEQRTAIELYYRQEMKVREVAEVMGKSEDNIKVLLHRGRNAVGKYISGQCGGPHA